MKRLILSPIRLLRWPGLGIAMVCCVFVLGPASALARHAGTYDAAYIHKADEQIRQQLQRFYRHWQGVPYAYGGTNMHGVDCSGFVYRLFRDVYGLRVPRTTRELARLPWRVDANHLIAGDVLIFGRNARNLHVGVYLADGEFIHASKSKGVIKSSLSNPYWASRYIRAVRVQASH